MTLSAEFHHAVGDNWRREGDNYVTWFRDAELWLLSVQGDPHFLVPLPPLGVTDPAQVAALVGALEADYPAREHHVMQTDDGPLLLTPAAVPKDTTELTLAAAGFAFSIMAAIERGL